MDRVTPRRAAFAAWPVGNRRPLDTKGGKPLVDVGGEPAFGEIALLRAFQEDGWEGRWIDNFPLPPTFRVAYWDEHWEKIRGDRANQHLPRAVADIHERICREAGDPRAGGAWDIIAWRGDEMAFVEAKKQGSSDRIKEPQLRWLDALERLGIPRESRLFVEWSAM
jgi:hypothetical protein